MGGLTEWKAWEVPLTALPSQPAELTTCHMHHGSVPSLTLMEARLPSSHPQQQGSLPPPAASNSANDPLRVSSESQSCPRCCLDTHRNSEGSWASAVWPGHNQSIHRYYAFKRCKGQTSGRQEGECGPICLSSPRATLIIMIMILIVQQG
ncbi:unnamed protein product [Pleuronectes platessa]|uniref:Uncharacterized protein n=1 Tax=Pleuronectes platessa TaxID=8262 RepID=A0A9N7W1C0_PLEPL|nr:unnamed protein product [Pleuronectes platessa]